MNRMSFERAPPAARVDAAEWWRGAVIYQVYPRSFADTNGDGIGDLPGVTAHLDHIGSLGVDAIWVSPFFTSPMKDFGYDIADYRSVDPIFGTLGDFDELLARAHALGLKVLIDQVWSHTSDEHDWFRESRSSRDNPKADWYVWADAKADGSPPNNWQSVFHGPSWTWDARRGQYYLHNFLAAQPDLNLHHPGVQDAILDTARFWLDRGVDGFRLDALNFAMHDPTLRDNPPVTDPDAKRLRPFDFQHHLYNQSHGAIPGFLERVRALFDSYPGARFTVAEVGGEQADREMKLFTHGPSHLHSAYGFNFLYADRLTPRLVAETMALWPGGEEEGWPSWAFSNHDAPRVVSRWRGRADRGAFARLAMLLLVALRGNVFLYQGEELGLPQAHVPFERLQDAEAIANWPATLGRDGARTPMPWAAEAPNAGFSAAEPWLPIDPAHRPLAVDLQDPNPESMLNFTRRLVALRTEREALRLGALKPTPVPAPLVAFQRGEGELLCVFNLGDETPEWALPPGWRAIAGTGTFPQPLSGVIAERL
jgi:alpha-glucosidase